MNAFRDYLIEIGKYPLLTAEEELELAFIMNGDGNDKVKSRARQKLINSNLRLVVSIAKNYKNSHLSIADLVSEGNIGLITAVDKYNPELGYRFSTCATPWIKQAISKAITDKGRNIRIPAHIFQLLGKYRQALAELESDGHTATNEEIAKKLNVETEKVEDLKHWLVDTISLQTPLGDDSRETVEDLIADTHTETPTEYVERTLAKEKLLKIISTLKPRTQQIIKLRYGIGADGDEPMYFEEHTLEEIGDILGITRERVRQIEKQTLAEIKLLWDRP